MKAYTNIEQSKKLAEILPIESADMYYEYVLPRSNKLKHIPSIGNPVDALEWYNSNKGYTHFGKEPLSLKEYCIPCWSLVALLEVLPHRIDDIYELDMGKLSGNDGWYVCYDNGDNFFKHYVANNNLIDACYEMIIKLYEEKLL